MFFSNFFVLNDRKRFPERKFGHNFPKKLVDRVLDSKRGNDKEYPMEVSNDWERKMHDMSPDGMDSIHHAMRSVGAKRPNVDFPSKYDKKEQWDKVIEIREELLNKYKDKFLKDFEDDKLHQK